MQTFSKEERLCGEKEIDQLFEKGEKFKEGSFGVIWQETKEKSEFPAKILISIPKRNIPKANQRNMLKRLLKECYRKQKKSLYQLLLQKEKHIIFAIIYQKTDALKYKELESEINLILNRLKNKL
tara:strand:+ start:387 stop:761 length:375 start_codon:yes stop_codon:yes gene_type:complete